MSCSGHSPPLSQTGQSSGWLISRNSTTARCATCTRSVRVCTTMPSLTGVDRLAELRLVAEDRDLDVAVLGRVDEHRVPRRGDLAAVDRERDEADLGPRH